MAVQYVFLLLGVLAHGIAATIPARPTGLPPDRAGNISCIGDQYGLDLPMINGFNPNLLTMQQLCAMPQYGGQPNQHIGGWCDARFRSRLRWHLSFDISPASGANPLLANPRVMLACSYRCWCTGGFNTPLLGQPKPQLEIKERPEAMTHKISIDMVTDFNVPWQDNLQMGSERDINTRDQVYVDLAIPSHNTIGYSSSPFINVNSTRLYFQSYPSTGSARAPGGRDADGYTTIRAFDTAMDEDNRINCPGELPRFPFPARRNSYFDSLQSLCAVQDFGGKQ